MSSANPVVLCTYHYDATDRLADCAPAGQDSTWLFYQKSRLATQIQGQIQHTLLRTDEHLLAQRRTENNESDSALLLTDQQQSVIAAQGLAFAYTPYGHRHPSAGPMSLPGFTGQRADPVTGHYLLGNGYRAFNPVLMRFNSPDSLSPFGEGGLNAYAYCEGDPVNRVDSSGHMWSFMKYALRRRNINTTSSRVSGNRVALIPPSHSVPTVLDKIATDAFQSASHENLKAGPLTGRQKKVLDRVSRYMRKDGDLEETLFRKSALAMSVDRLSAVINSLPQGGVARLRLEKIIELRRQPEYLRFFNRYVSAGDDHQRVRVIHDEVMRDGGIEHVALSGIPEKLSRMLENIRGI
ncbi:RHS repeat-associated core domain-containing protein [Pseudomonas syringae]|uniref:RHS repeat-associated core domain-containing protein n=1 Tax=Pseudomonas syringae TaxID=317 RepID=UPI00215A4ED3|nr:RHS repeat-associated core domain-containing protein [Pseudomonas syringae]MCR8719540.1 RHS repeat-associated core domain-containing protein [Pseudomonas syringae]